jgi:hypothetical protein
MDWREALNDPETNERLKHVDALLALQIAVGAGDTLNEACHARGQAFLDRFIAGLPPKKVVPACAPEHASLNETATDGPKTHDPGTPA